MVCLVFLLCFYDYCGYCKIYRVWKSVKSWVNCVCIMCSNGDVNGCSGIGI